MCGLRYPMAGRVPDNPPATSDNDEASMTGFGKRALFRLYQDFLMSDRLADYEQLLERAAHAGYRFATCEDWADMLESGAPIEPKVLVLRHDIDTDPACALPWSHMEREVGARGSYFFRLSTLDDTVIREVMDRGCHVSYHFEELADVAKERKLRSRAEVERHMPEICDRFAANVAMLRARYGWSMRVVSSHGDWVNRRLGISNHAITRDPGLRARLGIAWETYDSAMMKPLAAYFSDDDAPAWWKPGPPEHAIDAGVGPMCVLMHPKQWRLNVQANVQELKRRIAEGLEYRGAGA